MKLSTKEILPSQKSKNGSKSGTRSIKNTFETGAVNTPVLSTRNISSCFPEGMSQNSIYF